MTFGPTVEMVKQHEARQETPLRQMMAWSMLRQELDDNSVENLKKVFPPEYVRECRRQFATAAVKEEVLDPKELTYYSINKDKEEERPEAEVYENEGGEVDPDETFLDRCYNEISMIRGRYIDLKDAPKVGDSLRFPPREMINPLLEFNRKYLKHLEKEVIWNQDRRHHWDQAIAETKYLHNVWDTARDARCEYYYVTIRRLSLKKLKDMIGDEAYWEADLPPYVPIWRFREIK